MELRQTLSQTELGARVLAKTEQLSVRKLVGWVLAFQLVVAALAVLADVMGAIWERREFALRPEITEPVTPGDQTRRYASDVIPVRPAEWERRREEVGTRLPVEPGLRIRLAETEKLGTAVVLEGSVEAGDFERFEHVLEESTSDVTTVVLHSPGGLVGEAIRIGRAIRSRGMTTVVEAGDSCVSACPLMLFAGEERYVARDAWIGMHQAYFRSAGLLESRKAVQDIQRLQGEILRFTEEMGVSPSVHVHALVTPPDEAYFLVEEQLLKYRVATMVTG